MKTKFFLILAFSLAGTRALCAATVRIVAREGVAAVTHRRVAGEAGVALSSTTWHFATKADILEAALHWTARQEVERIAAIADRLGDADFDPAEDPYITAPQARAIDFAIDLYNEAITAAVGAGRDAGRDWYLFDIAGTLDRLASRR